MTVNAPPELMMALNNLAERQIAASRQAAAAFSTGALDTKRPRAYCEYGFPDNPCFDEFYRVYKRHGIGHGALMQVLDKTWQTPPWILEGEDEYDETRDETQWEKDVKRLFKKKSIWCAIKETDKRKMVGGYAGMIIQVKDSKQWNQPLGNISAAAIVKFIPAWRGSLEIAAWDNNQTSPTYGQPLMYTYREHSEAIGDSPRMVEMHPSRVIIFGSITEPESIFEPVLNALISLEKVTGGSGEAYIKAAARAIHIGFDKDTNLQDLARAHGMQMSEIGTLYDSVVDGLNRGIDSAIVTQGGQVSAIASAVPDPTAPFQVNLEETGAGMQVPSTIIVGRQTGTLASNEDVKAFNRFGQSRRENEVGPNSRLVVDWLMDHGVIERREDYEIMWDQLTESTDAEKLLNAKTMSEVNAQMLSSGQPVFNVDEIRVAAGYEAEVELDPLPDIEPPPEDQAAVQ
jgi:hypothetical protein